MSKLSALFLSLCLLLPACQQQHEPGESRKAENEAAPPLHIGSVHQVYPEQGFALLRIIGPMPPTGSTLISHPPDGSNSRLGNLCISSQKPTRDHIIAADIRSGTILKGDRIFQYRNISQQGEQEEITVIDAPEGSVPEQSQPDTTGDLPNDSGDDDTILETSVADGVETTVLPVEKPKAPGSDKGAPGTPFKAPDYINDIPDNISDWD